MSSIDKLLIRGIRSFGPAQNDQAVIEFGKPVTLIWGQNGAGKTTIIECLKYATTGEFPPMSKNGAFIIDPKLIGEREVKAVVKLKFKDTADNTVICHRQLQGTLKLKKMEVKTTDVSMEKKIGGENRKITSRCAEIDREMIAHLGVSKAILSNVVFCHQEDSLWPLGEGKALKTKFDDIFASTRYSKALEAIKKVHTEQTALCRQYKQELKYLEENKRKANELHRRLDNIQHKMDVSTAEVSRIRDELSPVEERLKELNRMYEEVKDMEKKIAELESSKRQLRRYQQELEDKIDHPFVGSEDELLEAISAHQQKLEKERAGLDKLMLQKQNLVHEQQKLKDQINEKSKERGRLETEEQYHLQRVKSRNTRVRILAMDRGIPDYDQQQEFSASAIRSFLSKLSQIRQRVEEEAADKKSEFLEKEKSLVEQENNLRDEKSRLQQRLDSNQKLLVENIAQVDSITKKLARIGSSASMIERLDADIGQAEQELSEYQAGTDIERMELQLQELREQKGTLDKQVSDLQSELSRSTQQSTARGALDVLQKDKDSKEQDYQHLFASIESALQFVTEIVPSEDRIPTVLLEMERSKRKGLQEVSSESYKKNAELSSQKTQLTSAKKQLERWRDRVEELQRNVQSVCGSTNYQQRMKENEEEIASLEDKVWAVRGSQSFFKSSLEKARTSHKCPLCSRGYDSDADFQLLLTSIERRLNSKVPELTMQYEAKLSKAKDVHEHLQQLKPIIKEMEELQTNETPLQEQKVQEISAQVETLKSSLRQAETKKSALEAELDQVRKLQPQANRLSELRAGLSELDKEIGKKKSQLDRAGPTRSTTIVNRELQKKQMEVEDIGRKMDNKRQEIASSGQTLRQLEDQVHKLRRDKLQLEEQKQQEQSLIARKEELNIANESLKREIGVAKRQVGPLGKRLEKVEREKVAIVKRREKADENDRTEIEGLRAKEQTIQSDTKLITQYETGGAATALQECVAEMERQQAQAKEKESVTEELAKKIDTLHKQLANAKVRERELLDSLQLLQKQEEISEKERKIQELKRHLQSQGLDQYQGEYQQKQERSMKLRKEQARLEGQLQGQEAEMKNVQKDLSSSQYEQATQRHRDMVITLKTTEIANGDLQKYHVALDRAIMRFHSMKMAEINKIIKDLWMKIYKGGDIDTIEIRSEDETEETGMSKRRVYHYRVVMVKGDTALDMRGRCSAGQKVLASIIIRLALAETFCLHCGLLALDEPTTNLDQNNIEGLAHALADIIRERSCQKNFQMIIITHDAQFVEMLGRSEFVDDYYLVKKELGKCSSVQRAPISSIPQILGAS